MCPWNGVSRMRWSVGPLSRPPCFRAGATRMSAFHLTLVSFKDTAQDRKRAQALFDKLLTEHHTAYKLPAGGAESAPLVHTKTYDPTAQKIKFAKQLHGG
jgi:hypothetical protein